MCPAGSSGEGVILYIFGFSSPFPFSLFSFPFFFFQFRLSFCRFGVAASGGNTEPDRKRIGSGRMFRGSSHLDCIDN